MNKFEYKVVTLSVLYGIPDITNYDIERLNDLGDEGWEVCAVDGPKYLLKRVKQGKEVKNITDFHKTYCDRCGTQRCDRSEEWMNGCPHYKEWKGM
mgnify:CR=1 FL=1